MSSDDHWQRRVRGEMNNEDDTRPPFRLLTRPPQFPEGKTATAINIMKGIGDMIEWIFNYSVSMEMRNLCTGQKYKRIVHLIFVNNNLIEGDQWRDRLIRRGVQNAKVFSSKSDVTDAAALNQLITEGEYINGRYIPVNFVLQCTHPTRLNNYTGEDNGDSLLHRLETFSPDIGVMCWFDEIDKFVKLLKDHIPRFQKFSNVLLLNGITATPYQKFWDIMHECGYYDIDLIGELPNPSNYMTFSRHEIVYSDGIGEKSSVKNFQYILEHPGTICHKIEEEGDENIHVLPNLTENSGSIIFVPGEIPRKTHMAIMDLALTYGKNCLVINGKDKAFYRASDGLNIPIYEYKQIQIRRQEKEIQDGRVIAPDELFTNMTAMDIAVHMYNDPLLDLKSADLVITGFNCVERGVTFNRPNFQFHYAILAPCHLKEGSTEIESIVQLAGRTHGSDAWVKKITVISPKYIVDEVNKAIESLIQFLRNNTTKKINHAVIFRETNGIPIRCDIHDLAVCTRIVEVGKMNGRGADTKRQKIMEILKEAVSSGKATLTDKNLDEPNRIPFSFDNYKLNSRRISDNDTGAKNYRFPQFYNAHITQRVYGQSITTGEFDLDLTLLPVKISNNTILPAGTAFISFAYKQRIIQEVEN